MRSCLKEDCRLCSFLLLIATETSVVGNSELYEQLGILQVLLPNSATNINRVKNKNFKVKLDTQAGLQNSALSHQQIK